MNATMAQRQNNPEKPVLKPMKFCQMLLLFFIPAATMYACVYVLWPFLTIQGMSSESAYVCASSVTTGGMLIASLIAYALEGNPLHWAAFKQRFRLEKMNRKGWLWTLGGLAILLAISALANHLLAVVYNSIQFIPPLLLLM